MVFLTVGHADAKDRIIGTLPDDDQPVTFFMDPKGGGMWPFFWTVPNGDTPSGDIAAGDVLGAGDAEVDDLVSCWPHWYYDWSARVWVLWDNGKWEKKIASAYRLTTGKIWSGD